MIQSTSYMKTLAYRNANPANIRYVETNSWMGLIGSKNGFCTFVQEVYGIRALIRILKTYHDRYQCYSIRSIITRFAPSSENDTEAYISFVRDFMFRARGDDFAYLFSEDDTYRLLYPASFNYGTHHNLFALCCAICQYESGYILSDELFARAMVIK